MKLKTRGKIHKTLTGFDFRKDERLRPLKAIRFKCLECSGTPQEVKKCEIFDCPLWPLRAGKGIRKPTTISIEEMAVRSARLKTARESRKKKAVNG